uniref:FBA_2 domain-containing protein n=1 Tax=Caenorhabditis tropicalis TaxID=1561998 RepID=A0A1I7USJ6_9PELO
MFSVPCDGPFGCFDYHGLKLVCVDETKNMVFISHMDGTEMEKYTLPSSLSKDFYVWVKTCFINGRFLLGLLKSHHDKSFHLMTISLNQDQTCSIIKHVPTKIISHGLRVEAHRSMSQIVFSICNTKVFVKKPIQRTSDRQSFMKQLRQEAEKTNGMNGDLEKVVEDVIVEEKIEQIQEMDGDIIPTILSTGRRRYGIKIHRTRSIREFRRTFSTKFMTRWRCVVPIQNSCEPFLWGNNACIISRDNPTCFYLAHTILNPKSGFIASILHKLSHRFSTHTPVTEPIQSPIRGQGPPPDLIWSNIDILTGMPTFLTMNQETLRIVKWQVVRDVYGHFDWRKTELDIEGPEGTSRILFKCNAENNNSSDFTIRFQLQKSDGKSHFYHFSIPRIVVQISS